MMQSLSLDNRLFQRRLKELGSATDITWGIGLTFGLSFTITSAYLFPYPVSEAGLFLGYGQIVLRTFLYIWAERSLRHNGGGVMGRLYRAGFVIGIFAIFVDWVLVHHVTHGRVVYLPTTDIGVLESPLWLPFGWACGTVETVYPFVRIFSVMQSRFSHRAAAALTTLFGTLAAAMFYLFYEFYSGLAGWWRYEGASMMIGDFCALYIVLGEIFMITPALFVAAHILSDSSGGRGRTLTGGLVFSVLFASGTALFHRLLEGR